MGRRAEGVALLLASLLNACDGASPLDASVGSGDAGVDAGSDAGPTDAGMADAGVLDAGPPPALHCAGGDLLIEELDPGVTVTLFNPTDAPVETDSGYSLCQQPLYVSVASLEAGVTIAPGGRHVFPWPSSFRPSDAGGEVALYSSGAFASPDAQIDFVCWGSGHSPSRKSVAEMDGDWSGDCAGAITGDSLRRIADTAGAGAADYDPTGATAALTCP